VDKNLTHLGKVTTVKILKDLNSRTKLAAIGVVRKDVTYGGIWIKLNPNTGLPYVLPSLSKLVGSDDWGRRIATSITSQVETMRLPPSHDISSIIDKSSGDQSEISLWSEWCKEYSKQHWKPKFSIQVTENRYHTSTSAGPNGGASLISASFDALVIRSEPYWELYKSWCVSFDRKDLIDMVEQCSQSITELRAKFKHVNKFLLRKEPLVPAKLLFLADKAGKTRVVYCLTWWVQELLHPLHRGLYKLLYTIKEDGTKSHGDSASIVKQWTSEGKRLWSVDLTNATDRFPKELQEAVISGLLGSEQGRVWSEIMSIKAWSPFHKSYVEYGAGQPMGAKTSWAIFALTHHTILRLICSNHGCYDNPYVIIGDDIVIANDKVANSYIEVLNTFGVPYSESKTIFPKEGDQSSAEFAKRIFRGGVEYSPLTSSLVDRVWKYRDYPVFLSLLAELKAKWESECYVTRKHLHFLPPAWELFQSLPKDWKETIAVSLGGQEYVGSQSRDNPPITPATVHLYDNPWADIDMWTYDTIYNKMVTKRVQGYIDQLTHIYVRLDEINLEVLPKKATVSKVLFHIKGNPLNAVVKRVEEVTGTICQLIAMEEIPSLQDVMDLGLDLSYMVSLIDKGRSWQSHKRLLERRNKSTIKFWKDVRWYCLPGNTLPDSDDEEW